MPLVQAKCTNCGANLEVENTKDAAICPYCGTPYVVEKAINNFNTVNHISAGVVNVYGANSADFVIRAGKLEKYNGAATEVVIPNNVITIGCEAFWKCTNLKEIIIPESVTSIEDAPLSYLEGELFILKDHGAFTGCNSLSTITIPGSVKHIGDLAFCGCSNLKTVVLSDGVESIGVGSFNDCRELDAVSIPQSVTSIATQAFSWCGKLREVQILGHPTLGVERLLDDDGHVVRTYKKVFEGCNSLTNIVASDEWKQINWEYAECLRSYKPKAEPALQNNRESAPEKWFCRICGHTFEVGTPPEYCPVRKTPTERRGEQKVVQNGRPASGSSGCYIATAIYGSYDCPQVWTLRRYRDNKLAKSWYGRAFIQCYYIMSPLFVRWFGNKKWFQSFWRQKLDNKVLQLNAAGTLNTPYNDKQW